MDSEKEQRLFSKDEISKILEEASRVTAKQDKPNEDGLTKQELVKLAKETGISADAILSTIDKLDNPDIETTYNWLQRTSNIHDISTMTGEMSEDDWNEIVHEIQLITRTTGHFKQVGNSFQWEHRVHEFGHKAVSLTSKNGKIKIQTTTSWKGLKFFATIGSFGLAFALTLLGIFFLVSLTPDFRPSLFLAIVASLIGAFPISSILLKSYFGTQKKQFKRIRERISDILKGNNKPSIFIEDKNDRLHSHNTQPAGQERISDS